MHIQGYNYKIKYIKSEGNVSADFLSCCINTENGQQYTDMNEKIFELTEIMSLIMHKMKVATSKEANLQNVIKYTIEGWPDEISEYMEGAVNY